VGVAYVNQSIVSVVSGALQQELKWNTGELTPHCYCAVSVTKEKQNSEVAKHAWMTHGQRTGNSHS
jgi:hypothetical protein